MEPTRPSEPPALTELRAAFEDAARRSCVLAPFFALLLRLLETLGRLLADHQAGILPLPSTPVHTQKPRAARPRACRPARHSRRILRQVAPALARLACALAPVPVLIPIPLRPAPRDIRPHDIRPRDIRR